MRRTLTTTLLTALTAATALAACDRASEETVQHVAEPTEAARPTSDDAAADKAAKAAPYAGDGEIAAGESGGMGRSHGAFAGPGVAQQAAGVRAGEWDDNANYREFLRTLEAWSSLPNRKIDLRHRRFIVVRDAAGRAVPNCRVAIADGSHSIDLVTGASGRALLFPHAEGLHGGSLTATARCGSGADARFDLTADDAVVDLQLDDARSLPPGHIVDLAFILDTTGSMSEEIAAVKATIKKVASSLTGQDVTFRIGLVEYKDRTDAYVTKVYGLSTDVDQLMAKIDSLHASGGGDTPEDAAQGLHVAINDLDWHPAAISRLAFMIGDAPPQLGYQDGPDYSADMRAAAHAGIKIHTIAASGMDDVGQAVWRQIAQYTGGTNMFVLRGGAGPQSAGGGDPKDSCGGTHQQYSSGNLDELIVAKIKRELAAVDGDPLAVAGLGQDEQDKPCERRIQPYDFEPTFGPGRVDGRLD